MKTEPIRTRSEQPPPPLAERGIIDLPTDPASTSETDDEIGAAFTRGIEFMRSIQHEAGCIEGEVVWCPMLTAQYVMTAQMTGQTIAEERQRRFIQHFRSWQTADGGWGMHAESPAYVFVTALVYVALRTMGLAADEPMCARARQWLRRAGGVLHIPTWGKAWLAMYNLYDWKGVAPVLPELWLLPESLPVHPRRMYCHTRMIYLSMGYLYGVRYQTPVTPLVEDLRKELFDEPFEGIDFGAWRYRLAPGDTFEHPPAALKLVFEVCRTYDRFHSGFLRRKALDTTLDRIVQHQRESRFAAISPVNGLLNCLALQHAEHSDFEASFRGVDYWSWTDKPEGERFNGARSHTWDTSFSVQAVCEGPSGAEAEPYLQDAARYLLETQEREEIPDRKHYHRDQRLGGFCFSDTHHRWPVSDCTGEALSALAQLADRLPADQLPEPEWIAHAARFVLSRQNPDGGFGSYERYRGGAVLKLLNPSEMFGNCMVEYSYVECSASCMQGLRHALTRFGHLFDQADRARMEKAISRGAALLRRTQRSDGAWPGFWGVNYTYGTLFGIIGLLAEGASKDDPAILRACAWLVSARLPDGGWGESYRGCVEERYIPHETSQVIMTSWALMALLKADYRGTGASEAIEAGAALLLKRQLPNGDWPKEGVGGVFFNTAMHHYNLYKNYFPVWALGLCAKSRSR
jgi:lanosterol synthase